MNLSDHGDCSLLFGLTRDGTSIWKSLGSAGQLTSAGDRIAGHGNCSIVQKNANADMTRACRGKVFIKDMVRSGQQDWPRCSNVQNVSHTGRECIPAPLGHMA